MFVMATWGLNIVSIKYLTQHMDIQALAAVRIVIAFITVTLIIKARGSFHMEMSHYDIVPGAMQEKIVAQSKAERGELVEVED